MQTGTSGHVHIAEYIVGMSVDVCVCVCVIVGIHAFYVTVRRQRSADLLPLSNLHRAVGEARMSTSLCTSHSIRGREYFIW